ncbi:MAG: alpha/beta hydrolase family protein [Myxococcota bacterium]
MSGALVLLFGCLERDHAERGPPVGMQRLELRDPGRAAYFGDGHRPMVTSIWYPAAADASMEMVEIPPDEPIFSGGPAARDAALASEGPFPLVMMSHGTGGSGLQMMWLGRRLAERGFVAVAVDHHGNTAAEPRFDARGFRMVWERARDISRVLDQLLEDDVWGHRIDRRRVSAVGFSLGGHTVTALAGGITDLDRFQAFCAGPERDAVCEPQPEYPEAAADLEAMLEANPALGERRSEHRDSFRDPRITRFVALAPALAQMFTDESLASIRSPFLIIAGDADASVPIPTNARRLGDSIPLARLIVFSDVGHYTFLNPCNRWGRWFIPVCRDRTGVHRPEVHARVGRLVVEHLTTFSSSVSEIDGPDSKK